MRRYRDDLSEPRFEKKPEFTASEFKRLYEAAYKVVDAMVAEYQVPMVLDQATISHSIGARLHLGWDLVAL